jgi:hypothetical protein
MVSESSLELPVKQVASDIWINAIKLTRPCYRTPKSDAGSRPLLHRATLPGFPRKIREIYAQGGAIISLVWAEAIARQARRARCRRPLF